VVLTHSCTLNALFGTRRLITFLQGPVSDRNVRQEILSSCSPCILMTVVRMLFFDVLNLTIFVKKGTSVSQFVTAGWWFVCFLAAHLSGVEEKC